MIHNLNLLKLTLPLIILLTITSVFTYDFSLQQCSQNDHQQSPINIQSTSSLYFDEKYFRFLTNKYEELSTDYKWQSFPEERAVGFKAPSNKNMGSFIFVKDWSMYSYNLDKILFRTNSEHNIDGENFDVEMQLVHTQDSSYYPPGRRITLDVNYLVISIFFKKTDDNNPASSRLFEFMGLQDFGNLKKIVKLHHIVQHQPSYLYQGSLSYPECSPAMWLIYSQYHFIKNSDLTTLKAKINSSYKDSNTGFNARDKFPVLKNTEVYRNWNEQHKMVPRPTLMAYNSASYIRLSYVSMVSFLFVVYMIIF